MSESDPKLGARKAAEPPSPSKSDTAPDGVDATIDGGPRSRAAFELTGQTLGDYAILEVIGAGGGGQVYKAQHQHMGRIVAIKVLPRETMSNPVVQQRFQREVRAAAKLMHPNIVTSFDAGHVESFYYLVMEYIDGRSLAQTVRNDGPMAVGAACKCLSEVAEGVAYAHKMGLVHRDIKPGNIMLAKDGRVKVLDMGLARLTEVTSHGGYSLTEHGAVVGSVGYISPEQISDSTDVDRRADVYSLGCTLYYVLTGNAPYTGSLVETLVAHTKEPPPSLQRVRRDVPHNLELVFQRMVEKDRSRRYQSMEEVAEELQGFGEIVVPAPDISVADSDSVRTKRSSTSSTKYVAKAVSLDLGSTNSYMSWVGADGLPETINLCDTTQAIPSLVCYRDQQLRIGEEVLADLNASFNIPNTARDFVSKLGTAAENFVLDSKSFPSEVVAASLVSQVVSRARRRIGYFSHVSYTYPSCFGENRRLAYQHVFDIAGISQMQPIHSTLASAAYFAFTHGWLNPTRGTSVKTLLALRYGDSSFDASIIRLDSGMFATLAAGGDHTFGGKMWTNLLLDHIADQLQEHHGVDIRDDPVEAFKLYKECSRAKVRLGDAERVKVSFDTQGRALNGVLSRSFLLKSGAPMLEQLGEMLKDVQSSAGVEWHELDHILLTGGAARMPIVRDYIVELTGQGDKCAYLDPAAAPNGAALYAMVQLEPRNPSMQFAVRAATTHYCGLAPLTPGKLPKKIGQLIFLRNTPLPAKRRLAFRTKRADQRSIGFQILEGCDAAHQHFEPIGDCSLTTLPQGLPAGTLVNLDFELSETGGISVAHESEATGRISELSVERPVGLSADERAKWREWLETGSLLGGFDVE